MISRKTTIKGVYAHGLTGAFLMVPLCIALEFVQHRATGRDFYAAHMIADTEQRQT